ncbi:MAG: hypothetical protein ACRYFW_01065 [Janthinobacterium lividum]
MTRLHDRRSAAATFAIPALLAIATLVGLAAGLAGAERLSAMAWAGVGLPPFVALAGLWSGRPVRRGPPRDQATSSTCGTYAP